MQTQLGLRMRTQSISMFGDKRVIVVRQAGKLAKGIWQALLENRNRRHRFFFMPMNSRNRMAFGTHANRTRRSASLPAIRWKPGISNRPHRPAFGLLASASRARPWHISSTCSVRINRSPAGNRQARAVLPRAEGRGHRGYRRVLADASAGSASEPIDVAFEGDLPGVEPAMQRCLRDGTSAAAILTLATQPCPDSERLVRGARRKHAGSGDEAGTALLQAGASGAAAGQNWSAPSSGVPSKR